MSVSSLNLNHRFTAFLATFVFIVLISILRYESPSYLVVILYATLYGMLMSISFGRNHDSRNAKSFIFITLSTLLLWKVFIVFFQKFLPISYAENILQSFELAILTAGFYYGFTNSFTNQKFRNLIRPIAIGIFCAVVLFLKGFGYALDLSSHGFEMRIGFGFCSTYIPPIVAIWAIINIFIEEKLR